MKKKNRKNRKSIVLTDYCQQLKKAIEIEPTEDPLAGIVKSLVASLKVLLQLRPCKIANCMETLTLNNKTKQKLTAIQAYIMQSGFNKQGINRTPEKEEVTNYTVYLGANGSEIAAQPVYFWLNLSESENRRRAFRIISIQAKQFIESHIFPVIDNIEEIGQDAQLISVAL